MNEQRIREIARDAKLKMIMGETLALGFLPTVQLKFAELIVKECLDQIDKIRDGFEADNENQEALGADWAGLAVARHFGIKE
jgi:hypothetical protein